MDHQANHPIVSLAGGPTTTTTSKREIFPKLRQEKHVTHK